MAISDYQIQDLINKTNIVYNIVNNNLNTRVSDVLSNVINGNNGLQNRLTQVANQTRSDTNYQTAQIGSYINGAIGQTRNDIKYTTDNLTKLILEQSASVSDAVQKKIDASNAIIGKKLDSVNAELKEKVTSILAPILADVDKQTGLITANLTNGIINAQTDIKSAISQTQGLINNTTNNILTKLNTASTVTVTSGGNATIPPPTTSGFNPSDDPYNPYNLLQQTINEFRANNQHPDDSFFSSFIRTINGDKAADAVNLFTLPNISKALSDQVNQIQTIIDKTTKGDYHTLDEFYRDFKSLGVNTDLIGSVLQFLFLIPSLLNIGKELSGAFNARIEQLTVAQYELRQLDENTIVLAFIRNLIDYETAVKRLEEIGHKRSDAELILKQAFPKFSVQDYLKLAHLGKIDAKTLQTKLRELGYNEIDAVLQGYINEVKPGVNDLITFAVKEVYSPEITSLFGQYQDFPSVFAKETALLGMSEDNAKKYWAAHWQLPGASMGYDMFHRGIITLDQLKALLKALDVMPFWRDKLINLAYNVVARVDTRRLYAYGIWTKEQVYRNYLDEGYSPQNAADLTRFTIAYDKDHEDKHTTALKKKTHDVYIKSYLAGLINKTQAIEHISGLGYKREDIELELNLEDYENYVNTHKPKDENHIAKLISLSSDGYRKKSLARQDFLAILTNSGYSLAEANTEADFIDKEADIIWKETLVKEIQKLYFESLIDDNGVLTKLVSLGFSNSESLHIISQLQTLKSLDDKKPTQVQFKAMYEDGIISNSDYANELAEMGYNQKYIPAIIALSDGKQK